MEADVQLQPWDSKRVEKLQSHLEQLSTAQPQQRVPADEDKAANGKLWPILPQRGVRGSWEVALGTPGQAHQLTSHPQSLWEHPLSMK